MRFLSLFLSFSLSLVFVRSFCGEKSQWSLIRMNDGKKEYLRSRAMKEEEEK